MLEGGATAGPSSSSSDDDNESSTSPSLRLRCAICTSAMEAVAIGPCNHKAVCAICALRSRLCYGVTTCPLCKAGWEEVAVVPVGVGGVTTLPDWGDLAARLPALTTKPGWARGVFVDDKAAAGTWGAGKEGEAGAQAGGGSGDRSPPPRARRSRPTRIIASLVPPLALSAALQILTGRSCPACPPSAAAKLYPSSRALNLHVSQAHGGGGVVCAVCVTEGRQFTRDLPVFRSPAAAKAHADADHPACPFCRRLPRFYDGDALFEHMRHTHFTCGVCHTSGGGLHHFPDGRALVSHLGAAHHFCTHPACEGGFVAFATPGELAAHARAVHDGRGGGSALMPRFDRGRARPLDVPIVVGRGGGRGGGGGGGGAGFTLIDDDEDLARRAGGRGGNRPGGGGGGGDARGLPSAAASRLARARPVAMTEEAFPALPAAGRSTMALSGAAAARAAPPADPFPALGGGGGGAASGAPAPAPQPPPARPPTSRPPLVRVTSRCPCGRRKSHIVVELGGVAPPLACDAACVAERRATTLADAFGVRDRAAYVPVAERPSLPTPPARKGEYEGSLLHWAWHHRPETVALEGELAAFVGEAAAQRRTLPPSPPVIRQAIHTLAPHYGLASQSFGEGGRRHVELFKVGAGGGGTSAAVPTPLLSAAANRLALADVEKKARAGRGAALILTDVSPAGVDWPALFRRWGGGEYALEVGPPGAGGWGSAAVRFARPGGVREALDHFGGGVRGAFRVDRAATLAELAEVEEEAGRGGGRGAAAVPGGPAAAPPSSSRPRAQQQAPRRAGATPASASTGTGNMWDKLPAGVNWADVADED